MKLRDLSNKENQLPSGNASACGNKLVTVKDIQIIASDEKNVVEKNWSSDYLTAIIDVE